MGFNPFKIIGKAVSGIAGVVKTVAPIAANIVPGAATALGAAEAIAGGVGGGAPPRKRFGGLRQRQFTGTPGFAGPVQFTPTSGGPRSRVGTLETQPFSGPVNKIGADIERLVRGVAESFGRDIARGAATGAEEQGGIPLQVRGNLPTLFTIGAVGLIAVVGIVFVVRGN